MRACGIRKKVKEDKLIADAFMNVIKDTSTPPEEELSVTRALSRGRKKRIT